MRFRSRWAAKVRRDPFYNPHFERHFAPFTRIRLIDPGEEGQIFVTAVGDEKLCEESDVVTHYRVILGRDPESAAVVDEAKRQPLTRFVRGGFASGEFQ